MKATDLNYREALKNKEKIVVKIGTSSLTFENGRLNFLRIEQIAKILSTLRKQNKKVVLVTSGAIAVGAGRLGIIEKPKDLAKKQALAAVGQAELMKIYQKFFAEHGQDVAQVLLTKDVVTIPVRHQNAKKTLNRLLELGIIPIINENDTISTYEIVFGDNDTLSAIVASLIEADLLIMFSDIDGLYTVDPRVDKNATLIKTVTRIDDDLLEKANGAGTSFSTGGMITKLSAAKICFEAGIDMVITNGKDPEVIFDILEGKEIGTHFHPVKVKEY